MRFLAFVLFSVLLLWGEKGQAQEPAFFQFAGQDLGSNSVYDILVLKDGRIAAATEHGVAIVSMSGVQMLTSKDVMQNSYTDLQYGPQGKLYVRNFRNQLYRVADDSLELFLDLTKVRERIVGYHFWDETVLMFGMRTCLRYHMATGAPMEDWNRRVAQKMDENYRVSLGSTSIFGEDSVLVFGNTRLSRDSIVYKQRYPIIHNSWARFYQKDGVSYYLTSNEGQIHSSSFPDSLDCSPYLKDKRLYNAGHVSDYFWVSSNGGLLLYDSSFSSLTPQHWFTNYSISCLAEDQQGNLWVGTLEDGLLLVPSMKTLQYKPTKGMEGNYVSVEVIPDPDSVLIATKNGQLFGAGSTPDLNYLTNLPVDWLYDIQYENSTIYASGAQGPVLLKDGVARKGLPAGVNKSIQLLDHHVVGHSWYSTTLYPRSLAVDTTTTVLAFSMLEPVVRAKVWLADQPFEKLWAQRDGAKMLGANMGRCRSVSKEGIQFIDSTNGSPLVVSDIFTDASNAGYVLSSGGTVYQIDSVSLELDAIAQFDCSYVPEQLVVKGDLLVVYNNGELLYMDRTEGVQRRFNGLLPFSTDELIDLELTENYLWVAQTSQLFRVPYAALFQETLPLVQPLQLEGFPVAEASYQLPADPGPIRVFMHYTDVLAKHQLQYSYQLNEEEWINMERLTNVLTLSNLAAGNYDLGVRVKRGTQVVNERSLSFSIAPHWYETRWFIALLVLLVFGATVFFFRSRIQVIKKRNRVQQQLNEAQHTALKAQMNPHFLFNVLNSMQTMVLKEDKIKANKIMSELSVFVRKVLNYSGKALIPLQDELEMLHNYLKLEKHRFNEDFSYEVKVDPALEDAMHLLMPPMLLQPFVENAINHGLLHKKNDRQLNITFTQSGQELICAIEDNGVGRKRAAELQQKSKKHSSFASGASSRRINLLKDAGYQQADIHIEDRYHPNNQPAGTRVNLRLPLTHPT